MKRIGFFPMKRCNLRCAHCQNWAACGPEAIESTAQNWKQVIDKHIIAAAGLGYESIGLSGGELTLDMENLLKVISIAHNLGMTTSLVTNGWWGKNPTLAGDTCNTLKLAGLDVLRISYDSFHFEFLSQETVKRAITIAETFHFFDLCIYAIGGDAMSASDLGYVDTSNLHKWGQLYDPIAQKFHGKFKVLPVVSWDNCVYASCEGIPAGKSSEHYLGDLDVNTLEEILGVGKKDART